MDEVTFTLREAGGIPFYSCRALEDIPGLCHGFSTRNARTENRTGRPFSLGHNGSESFDTVSENRRRFLSALNLHHTPLLTLRQVHSGRVLVVKGYSGQWNPPDGDALICGGSNIAIAVQTADCFPVLIADPAKEAFAAIHAGWRGTLEQIALCAVRKMRDAFGCHPGDLLVAVGPGIRPCCYEVGEEVAELFERRFPDARQAVSAPDRRDRFILDLPGMLRHQFSVAGIPPGNVHDLDLCTRCNTDIFFSYRAEGSRCGRMMAAIGWT